MKYSSRATIWRMLALLLAFVLVAAACGDDDEEAAPQAPAEEPAEEPAEAPAEEPMEEPAEEPMEEPAEEPAEEPMEEPAEEPMEEPAEDMPVDLASVCPNPVVIQTDWFPQATHGFWYQLIDHANAAVDNNSASYSGPAVADPNLTIEIRGGGPLTGYQQEYSLLHADRDILLATTNLDAVISASAAFPTVGVFVPFDKHPQNFMWDPATHDISTIEDIRDSGATVLVSSNAVYAEALGAIGKLDPGQIDYSWDFSPARFVGEGGAIVQQGFATNSEYQYENSIEQWGREVSTMLVHDAGYPNYRTVQVHPDSVTEAADCLSLFVPLVQQAVVDFLANPGPALRITEYLSAEYSSPVPLSPEENEYATSQMTAVNLVGNGANDVLGDYEEDRVQEMIDITVPIFLGQGSDTVNPDVTAGDLYTNRFIDDSIGL